MAGPDKKNHSLAWLNATQFFGALNDNVFRWLVVFFLLELPENQTNTFIIPLVSFIFVLPFLLFSHAAGVLADRYSKRTIIVFSKWLELAIMTLGCLGIYLANAPVLYFIVFLMSTQSTIFGPSKYGIVPELVKQEDLSKANGYLTGLTYLAIIIGTFIPTYILKEVLDENFLAVSLSCLIFSVIGLVASIQIFKTPAVGSGKEFSPSFIARLFRTLFSLRSDRHLLLAVLGSVYFLFLGGFVQQYLVIFGMKVLGLSSMEAGYIFPAAALGIGLGALTAGKFSGRNIEFGLVPIGAAILTLSCICMNFINPGVPQEGIGFWGFITHIRHVILTIFALGIGSGLFMVPLTAFIQYQSPRERLGEILACVNFFSFLGVALSAAAICLLDTVMGVSPNTGFLVGGVLTGILTVLAIIVLPDFLVRFIIILLTKIIYRIQVKGIENIPVSGPALIVPNHVTWVDALLIAATQQRRVRFMMDRDIMNHSAILKPIFKLMHVIPVSSADSPGRIKESLQQARACMEDGYMVCIFAEGGITRNGNMLSFKSGMERIARDSRAPIIPTHIGGAWGSIFSYYHGRLLSGRPAKVPYPVSIIFGKPMPDSSTSSEVRLAILELSAESFELKKNPRRSLPFMFVKNARKHWFKPGIADTTGKDLNFGKTLIASLAVAGEIKKITTDEHKIGVLLPSSVGGALVNAAIALLGKVSVNLNFTASRESIENAIEQCEIKTVISSLAFLEKLDGFEPFPGTVYLEDIMLHIGGIRKFIAFLKARFLPIRLVAPGCRICRPDDLATVIFSSGSTAQPKGIMLSHHNIISNIHQVHDVYHFSPAIGICGILPFFHSFGYTVTLWCPLIMGARVVYHSNPVDGPKVAEIIRKNKLTMLLTTPTFLLVYIRKATREDFQTLKIIITGAEKLKPRLADSFEEKFGIRPLEGYGTTELSPVTSSCLPDIKIGRVQQIGNKQGSIGHPLPGVAMKIVDHDTGDTLPQGAEGMLMVKGPNVMLGYINNPEKTNKVLRNGWYETGDIAKMDKDGFVYIMDRMSRFSKIGGEMVPHVAIEEKLMHGTDTVDHTIFVTAAEDEKKGEQIVVLYTEKAGDAHDLHDILHKSDIPNLWKPKKDNYFKIDVMPTLGSGKLDLKQLKDMAHEFVKNKPGLGQKIINTLRDNL